MQKNAKKDLVKRREALNVLSIFLYTLFL